MKILLTGSFGNIGTNTLYYLLKSKHEVTCFDLKTKNNLRKSKQFLKYRSFNLIWGHITDKNIVRSAVTDKDCIIHLAGLTPPLTELKPELAYQINVLGTQNILDILDDFKQTPKFIFSSSFSIYGPQLPDGKLKNVSDPVIDSDVYTAQKIEIENCLKKTNLPWIIFRIVATPSLSIKNNQMSLLYEIPLEQQIDFLHPKDVGYALSEAVNLPISNCILNLGGSKECQIRNREFLGRYLDTLGIGKLPDDVFKIPENSKDWYYSSWVNSLETQKLMNYQNHTFDDFLEEIRRKMKYSAPFIKIFSPIIRYILMKNSPYYKKNISRN